MLIRPTIPISCGNLVAGDSQLVDNPEQTGPASGALMFQLVIIQLQQHSQLLTATDDDSHILEEGRWAGEPRHCSRGQLREIGQRVRLLTLDGRGAVLRVGLRREGGTLEHHSKQGWELRNTATTSVRANRLNAHSDPHLNRQTNPDEPLDACQEAGQELTLQGAHLGSPSGQRWDEDLVGGADNTLRRIRSEDSTRLCYQQPPLREYIMLASTPSRLGAPLFIIRSLDKVEEDVKQLITLLGLWMKAGGGEDEGDQLLSGGYRGRQQVNIRFGPGKIRSRMLWHKLRLTCQSNLFLSSGFLLMPNSSSRLWLHPTRPSKDTHPDTHRSDHPSKTARLPNHRPPGGPPHERSKTEYPKDLSFGSTTELATEGRCTTYLSLGQQYIGHYVGQAAAQQERVQREESCSYLGAKATVNGRPAEGQKRFVKGSVHVDLVLQLQYYLCMLKL
ncbi:hypothetical protein Z043_122597, partial [Scleropages formosus]